MSEVPAGCGLCAQRPRILFRWWEKRHLQKPFGLNVKCVATKLLLMQLPAFERSHALHHYVNKDVLVSVKYCLKENVNSKTG